MTALERLAAYLEADTESGLKIAFGRTVNGGYCQPVEHGRFDGRPRR